MLKKAGNSRKCRKGKLCILVRAFRNQNAIATRELPERRGNTGV